MCRLQGRIHAIQWFYATVMAAIGRELDPKSCFQSSAIKWEKPPSTRRCSSATEIFQTLRLKRTGQGDTEGLIVDTDIDTDTDERSVFVVHRVPLLDRKWECESRKETKASGAVQCLLSCRAGDRCRGREERVPVSQRRRRRHETVSLLHPAALPSDPKHDLCREAVHDPLSDSNEHARGVPVGTTRATTCRHSATWRRRSATCRHKPTWRRRSVSHRGRAAAYNRNGEQPRRVAELEGVKTSVWGEECSHTVAISRWKYWY